MVNTSDFLGEHYLGPQEQCEYLPGQVSQLEYVQSASLTKAQYRRLLDENWRRFGLMLFRPQCGSCDRCSQLRIDVEQFTPSRSQHRVWRRNFRPKSGSEETLRIEVVEPTLSASHLDLYSRYHRDRSSKRGWSNSVPISPFQYAQSFLIQPFATQEWQYRLGDKLVGVSHIDVLEDAFSAIYFFSDPALEKRSLGVLNILALISEAKKRSIKYLYLGYFVEGSQSMSYKASYQPSEVLVRGSWQQTSTEK